VTHGADHLERIASDESVLPAYGLTNERFLLVVGTSKRTKNVKAVLDAWRRERADELTWDNAARGLLSQLRLSGVYQHPPVEDIERPPVRSIGL
jgi:hypothetical protein